MPSAKSKLVKLQVKGNRLNHTKVISQLRLIAHRDWSRKKLS